MILLYQKGGDTMPGNIDTIVQIVSSVGFPIVCCGFCFWYVKYITDKNREDISCLNEQHKEESNKMIEAINNNTLVMERLVEKIESKGGVL